MPGSGFKDAGALRVEGRSLKGFVVVKDNVREVLVK